MSENEIPQQEQSFDYQQTTPDSLSNAINEAEQSITATPDDVNLAKERQAFEKYVESTGNQVPDNFENAEAWFNSLKEAQKNYTQGQQEISSLREQLNNQTPPPQENVSERVEANSDELRITKEETPPEQPQEAPAFSNEDWATWSHEVATTGDLSQDTKQLIQNKTGFTPEMINDFLAGQKAKMRESRMNAANKVGGEDRLNSMFKWAAESLSQDEINSINVGLSHPEMQEITLFGLASKFDNAVANKASSKEPQRNIKGDNVASTAPTYTGYRTMREFLADRNNPRFKLEGGFRSAVEQRMIKTDFNNLPQ